MFEMFDRPDLEEVTQVTLAPLTALLPAQWPATWCELATSHFVTLRAAPGSDKADAGALAQLAMALALGIAQDIGGTQPYIPVGACAAAGARAKRAIEMLGARCSYQEAARATGLTENRVRKIEAEWRREQIALRQGKLDLGAPATAPG
jgi:Mor family transcriptional regulator